MTRLAQTIRRRIARSSFGSQDISLELHRDRWNDEFKNNHSVGHRG
jgi:hypothetical protein